MEDRFERYGRPAVEAAERLGLGILIAELAPARILHANAAATALYGCSEDELRARPPLDFVVPEQRELVAERLRRHQAGETLPPAELTITRADGTWIAVECRIVDTVVEERPAAVIFLTPPSPRVADLAADARYRAIVDAAPDGVAISRGMRFLYANHAAVALAGYSSFEELASHSLNDLLMPADRSTFTERTSAMLSKGARFTPRDYVVNGREREVVVEVSSMVIDFEGGPAVLAFVRDVTEARRAQVEIERTQRLTALGTLVAGVAHEVNNPLSFASMSAELLQRFFERGCRDLESGHAALANVVSGLDRIASLVRELRSFARSDESARVTTPLSDVLASALRMTAPVIRPRARLDVELGALPFVNGGPGRLEQVFVNLLINAAQSFEGGDLSANVVRVRASRTGGEVTLTIADNGRGIAAEHLPRVFDPFFTTKCAGEGVGLGLSICHTIVTQHGGRLGLWSEIGVGTTVTVTLPAQDGRAPEPHEARAPSAKASRSARILIVDDEPAIGQLLRDMLAPPHDVTLATRGVEAEDLLLRPDSAFDVILCDLTMPDIPGVVLFERACARNPSLRRRFVFMTGGLFPEELLRRTGATAPRLEKPFSAADVAAVIARVVDGG